MAVILMFALLKVTDDFYFRDAFPGSLSLHKKTEFIPYSMDFGNPYYGNHSPGNFFCIHKHTYSKPENNYQCIPEL